MPTWIEKGNGLHRELYIAGYSRATRDGQAVYKRLDRQPLTQADEAAVQAIINNYDPLEDYKKEKIKAIREETARRAQEINEAATADMLELLFGVLQAANVNPQGLTGDLRELVRLRQAARGGIQAVRDLTDPEAVRAFDVSTDISWPG